MADDKIVIQNVDHLISEIVNYAHDKKSFTRELYENMAQERYESDRDLRHYMITDFATDRFVGDNDDVIEMYKIGKRLNDIALNCYDPVMIAAMLGMSKNGTAFFADNVRSKLAPTYLSFLESFIKENPNIEVPVKYKNEFIILNNTAGKKIAIPENITPEQALSMPFEECPLSVKESVVTNVMSAFFDRKVLNNDNGERMPVSVAMKEFWDKAMTEAASILNAAFGDGKFVPENDEQKEIFAHLKEQCKKVSKDQKNKVLDELRQLTVENLIDDDMLELGCGSAFLKFESNYLLKDLTAESFIANNESRTLSYAETEWGEASFNRMLDLVYTVDELKKVKKLGFDPCTEVYIDGKSVLDLPTGETREVDGNEMFVTYRQKFEEAKPTNLDYAKLKCDICAAALSGKRLDICKMKEDAHAENGIKLLPPIAIETDIKDMKKEPVSLLIRILRFFNIIKDPDKDIQKSNSDKAHIKTQDEIMSKIGYKDLLDGADNTLIKVRSREKNEKKAELAAEKSSTLN